MDYRFRRDSRGCGTQENDSAILPGMERCLKKLVWVPCLRIIRTRKKVAGSRYVAEDALESIQTDYEPLPAVVDARSAVKTDAVRIHEETQGNLAGSRYACSGL